MARKPYTMEFGSGIDLRGSDPTKAAVRAVEAAIRSCTLAVLDYVPGFEQVIVEVTIGVPNPEGVRVDEVLKALPVGQKSVTVVAGGLSVPYKVGGSDMILLAHAAVRVSLEVAD